MKLKKTASGKRTVKMSKVEWQSIGKKAGWMKTADNWPPAQNPDFNEQAVASVTNYVIKTAKWKGNPEIKQTGDWAGKSIAELNKSLSGFKKKQENYKKKNDGKANKEYTSKLREINFAIRSKKKGKGKWGDV